VSGSKMVFFLFKWNTFVILNQLKYSWMVFTCTCIRFPKWYISVISDKLKYFWMVYMYVCNFNSTKICV
jgi:hypothetical protein